MNKFINRFLSFLSLGILCTLTANAIPASKELRIIQQPDGTSLTVRMIGDEYFHCLMTEDGYLIKKNSDGWYNYIGNNGELSLYRASNISDRSVEEIEMLKSIDSETLFNALKNETLMNSRMQKTFLRPRQNSITKSLGESKWDNSDGHDIRAFPTEGEQNVLVILVNFKNDSFTFDADPHAAMDRMMNEVGYDEHGATGSAYDFYYASSNGLFKPSFDVYGPVTLPNNYNFYGQNDYFGNDLNPAQMIIDACDLLDDEIDFTQYDRNEDGFVDNVYVIYAGYGEADTYSDDRIWPHAWYMSEAISRYPEYDGVKLEKYATSNELNCDDEPDGIGTFCHEFAHVLGLPDLYSTVYNENVFSPGAYSALDYGPYNNNKRTPPIFSSYEQYALEWQKPIEITAAETICMLPLTDRPVSYKISADITKPTEYFLFENRQLKSWDRFIPGHGMLVWHIDYNESVWYNNIVNNAATHQYIDIIEADNKQTEATRAGDTFPGNSYFEFNSGSVPEFMNWNKKSVNYPLTAIQESPDGVISFKVLGGGDENSSLYLEASTPKVSKLSNESFSLSWNEVANATGYCLTIFPMEDYDGKTIMTYVDDYKVKNIGNVTSIDITGLEQNTTYAIILYTYSDFNAKAADVVYVNTLSDLFEDSYTKVNVSEISDVTANISWSEIPDAENYFLTVATRSYSDSKGSLIAGFDNKNLPSSEWQKSGLYDSRTNYCGENTPSLKFSKQADYLISPTFDDAIQSISFWCRISREADARLEIIGCDSEGNLITIANMTDISSEGKIVEINSMPDDIRRIAIYYYMGAVELTLNLDDLTLTFAGDVTFTPIAEYDNFEVDASTLSINVTGLEKDTEYFAYVKANNGTVDSKLSRKVMFRTNIESGIENIPMNNNTQISVSNGLISIDNDSQFDVYSIDGKIIAINATNGYMLPNKGVYIIKTSTSTTKIVW